MARTVYPSAEIPHLFAANRDAEARTANHNLRCSDGVLWNYQEPIAAYSGDTILLSSDSFSITTSKHQSRIGYATRHLKTLYVPDLKSIVRNSSERGMADYIAKRVKEIDAIRDSITRMRAEWKIAAANSEIARIEAACEFVWNVKRGKKTPWQSALKVKAKAEKDAAIYRYTRARDQLDSGMEHARRLIDGARENMAQDTRDDRYPVTRNWFRLESAVRDITYIDGMGAARGLGIGSTATFTHAAKLMGKKWAAECTALALEIVAYADSFAEEIKTARAEYDAAEQARHAEGTAKWLSGESDYCPGRATLCRVRADVVETSHGARVPLAQALQFVELARACRESGKPMDLKGRAIGPYRGNSIDAKGNMTIGCHHITWEAIADCVARYETSRNEVTA